MFLTLLLYMASNYGFTTTPHYLTLLKLSTRCKKGQLSGFQVLSRLLQLKVSKPLQNLSPSNCMFKNLEGDLNFMQSLFLPIISFALLWILYSVLTIINICSLSAPSWIIKKQKSKGILLMLTTDHTEFFLLFLLSTLNFYLV